MILIGDPFPRYRVEYENPNEIATVECIGIGSVAGMAGEVGQEQLDFGAEGTGHGSFVEAHEGACGTAEKSVTRQPGPDGQLAIPARPHG